MADTDKIQKEILIEQRITNEGKSMAVAYILWWFLGLFGAHRFYLGYMGTAIAMLLISITVFGLIITLVWFIIDAFLIPSMIKENNAKLRFEIERQIYS